MVVDALFNVWADHPLLVTALTLTFFLFPTGRIRRWLGIFDPFADGERRRSWLLRGIVFIVDETDKRLFGRQKTGGWA